MAKKKGTAEVIFTRAIVGADLSYRKGQKARIDAAWAEQLAESGTVRILSGKPEKEKAVAEPSETAEA
jgi:hypothetical protein